MNAPSASAGLRVDALQKACATCNLRELCLPGGLDPEALNRLDKLIGVRRSVPKGRTLFHAGDGLENLFAVRLGFFKTVQTLENGREQVTGFQMAGELLGLDAISGGGHIVDAVALEDSQVCLIPFTQLEDLARQVQPLQHALHRLLSREIVRDQGAMLMLGSMKSDQRLAAFLLNLVMRLKRRGWSSTDLMLRMSREEIGSYLGLTLESVSRSFSHLRDLDLIRVDQREVHIVSADGLQALLDGRRRV